MLRWRTWRGGMQGGRGRISDQEPRAVSSLVLVLVLFLVLVLSPEHKVLLSGSQPTFNINWVGNLTKHRCRFRRIIFYSSSRMAMDMKERAELIAKQEEAMRVSQRANSHISAGESHFYVVTCHMWLSQRASGHMSAVSQITTQMVTSLWKKSKFQSTPKLQPSLSFPSLT